MIYLFLDFFIFTLKLQMKIQKESEEKGGEVENANSEKAGDKATIA